MTGCAIPADDDAYDLAVLSHVVEHVPEPVPLLREAARLAPRVIVEVPLEANRSARRPAVRAEAARIGHVHAFDRASRARAVRGRGAAVVSELTDPLSLAHHSFFAAGRRRAREGGAQDVRAARRRSAPRRRAPSACSPCTTRALPPAVDVALLSASPTLGWRMADDAFAALVRDAGATCAVVRVSVGRAAALQAPSGADRRGRGAGVAAQRVAGCRRRGRSWCRRVTARVLPAARGAVRGAVRRARGAEPAGLAGRVAAVDRAARAGARARVLLPWSAEAAEPLRAGG